MKKPSSLPNGRRLARLGLLAALLLSLLAGGLAVYPGSAGAWAGMGKAGHTPDIPVPAASASLNVAELRMLNAINTRRADAGLAPVADDGWLTEVARTRSQDMASGLYFSHVAPDGGTAFDLVGAGGATVTDVAEVLGRTDGGEGEAVDLVISAFMQSTTHRSLLLGEQYIYAGVGNTVGPDGTRYFVVVLSDGAA